MFLEEKCVHEHLITSCLTEYIDAQASAQTHTHLLTSYLTEYKQLKM